MMIHKDGRKIAGVHRWWKNGDHPDDNVEMIEVTDGDGNFLRNDLSEGEVVRRWAHPTIQGYAIHTGEASCGQPWFVHGWIDQGEDGLTVCPGDWVITLDEGYDVAKEDPMVPVTYDESYAVTTDPESGEEVRTKVAFYADCHICNGRRVFDNAEERDGYAIVHQSETRHLVATYQQTTS